METGTRLLDQDLVEARSGAETKERIKVMRIIARLTLGGPAIQVLLLNSELSREKYTSALVAGTVSEGEYDIRHLAREKGIRPIMIPELSREIKIFSDIAAVFKLYRLIKNLKPDIVHTHTAKAGTLGRIAALLNHVPIKIHTFHGHVFHSYFGSFGSRIVISIERLLARFTDRILVISEKQLCDVRDKYRIAKDEKIKIVPLGLDLSPFLDLENADAPGFRDKLTIDSETLLVGIVGRLVEIKNHKMFLDVVKRVKEKAPDVKAVFLIMGDGHLRRDLESYAEKLGVSGSVIFMGWQTDLVNAYKDLDMVALTSLNEGTPISLIEAMASAKAVISTDVGGVSDLVCHQETGILSPSNDADAFADRMIELLRDKAKRDMMSERARGSVRVRFAKERLLKDIDDLYTGEYHRWIALRKEKAKK